MIMSSIHRSPSRNILLTPPVDGYTKLRKPKILRQLSKSNWTSSSSSFGLNNDSCVLQPQYNVSLDENVGKIGDNKVADRDISFMCADKATEDEMSPPNAVEGVDIFNVSGYRLSLPKHLFSVVSNPTLFLSGAGIGVMNCVGGYTFEGEINSEKIPMGYGTLFCPDGATVCGRWINGQLSSVDYVL